MIIALCICMLFTLVCILAALARIYEIIGEIKDKISTILDLQRINEYSKNKRRI